MSLPLQEHIEKDGFRLRGLELSRIDGFSDVVFGFALTLLVVSLEVPKTYAELEVSLRGFVPFAISFMFLMLVWFGHYKFFRRFGTHDVGTVVLNAILLFVVLFYVYPLKFLFTFVSAWMMGMDSSAFETSEQLRSLMMLYGVGFAAIYFLFAALYLNGMRQRVTLGLNHLEEALTRTYIVEAAVTACIGLLACAMAWVLPLQFTGLSGWTYMLIAVFSTVYGVKTRRRIKKLAALDTLHTPAM